MISQIRLFFYSVRKTKIISQVTDAAIWGIPLSANWLYRCITVGEASDINACQMEDVGICCSSYCYIHHYCIALPQGGREIQSITQSKYTVWAIDLWRCFDVSLMTLKWCDSCLWCHYKSSCSLRMYCGGVLGDPTTWIIQSQLSGRFVYMAVDALLRLLVWMRAEVDTCLYPRTRLTKPTFN